MPSGDTPTVEYTEEELRERDQKDFDNYVYDLRLTSEDLKKSILDVGADDGAFEKVLKSRAPDSSVVSIDRFPEENSKVIPADVRAIPFEDDSFDLTISHNSVPSILGFAFFDVPAPSTGEAKVSVEKALKEMLRVTKPGGQVRFNNIIEVEGGAYWWQRFTLIKNTVETTLLKLNKHAKASFLCDKESKIEDGYGGTRYYMTVIITKLNKE